MANGLRGPILLILIAAIIVIIPPIGASTATTEKIQSISTPNGTLTLGMTKKQVIAVMGKPNSPENYDFVYSVGKSEIITTFNDQTKKLEAVIVRGDSNKFSVSGIKIGDAPAKVESRFGKPEISKNLDKGRMVCWYYPSKNVYFCVGKGDRVMSFSVSNCCEVILKK
jgi:hypothetical protein